MLDIIANRKIKSQKQKLTHKTAHRLYIRVLYIVGISICGGSIYEKSLLRKQIFLLNINRRNAGYIQVTKFQKYGSKLNILD